MLVVDVNDHEPVFDPDTYSMIVCEHMGVNNYNVHIQVSIWSTRKFLHDRETFIFIK